MANTNVFTGADGAITLSTAQGPEGDAARAAIEAHELITVGRATDVRVEVHSDVRAFHELGQRYATQLRPGNVTITGTLGRAYLNGALLTLLLGEAASSRPAASWTAAGLQHRPGPRELRRAGHAQHRDAARREGRQLGHDRARGRLRARAGRLPGALPQRGRRGMTLTAAELLAGSRPRVPGHRARGGPGTRRRRAAARRRHRHAAAPARRRPGGDRRAPPRRAPSSTRP